MCRVYAALAFLIVLSIGCADPSCPEGQTKIGNVCHRFGDASADSSEDDDMTTRDAGAVSVESEGGGKIDASSKRDATVAQAPASEDASSAVSDGSAIVPGADATGPASSLCAADNGGCDPLTTCSVVAAKVSCGPCPDGFSGDGASGCQQAPACSSNPCGANAACAASTTAPGYTCSCKPGFRLQGTSCVDIDECFEGTDTCHMTSVCANTEGSFDCTCPAGYAGGTSAGYACAPRVTTGVAHTCALLSDRRVKCWGNNAKGQLGDGTQLTQPTPVFVSGLQNVIAISATNSSSSCALLDDGSVKCWGDNAAGQLAQEGLDSSTTPLAIPDLSDVIAISVGPVRVCAVVQSGAVRCWGSNGASKDLAPTEVAGMPPAAGVAVGMAGGCALTKTADVWCWGAGGSALEVDGLKDVLQVASGATDNCVLTRGGAVKCWSVVSSDPTPPNGVGLAVSVAAGMYTGCAAQQDGVVKCWGAAAVTIPLATTTSRISAVAVATGGEPPDHVSAIVADGTIRSWGNNVSGQLGDGTTTSVRATDAGIVSVTTVKDVDLW